MPGYAKPFDLNETVTKNYGGRNGYPQIEALGSQVFYGFRIDYLDGGRLTLQVIDGSTVGDAVELPVDGVGLPEGGIKRYDDYKEWIWTNRNLNFYWGDDFGDHLYMEVI